MFVHNTNGEKIITLIKCVCTCFSENIKVERIAEMKEETIHWIAGLGIRTNRICEISNFPFTTFELYLCS